MVFKIQALGRVLGWRTSGAEDSRKVTWSGVCPEKEEPVKLSGLWSDQFCSKKRLRPCDFHERQKHLQPHYFFPKLPLYAGYSFYTHALPDFPAAPENLCTPFCKPGLQDFYLYGRHKQSPQLQN